MTGDSGGLIRMTYDILMNFTTNHNQINGTYKGKKNVYFELEVDNYTIMNLSHPLAQEHVMTNVH